jgi:hypothetical protein
MKSYSVRKSIYESGNLLATPAASFEIAEGSVIRLDTLIPWSQPGSAFSAFFEGKVRK